MSRNAQGHWALIILTLIAVIAALELAKTLLAPLVLAFVCAVVLSPVSGFWKRCGVPNTLGALLSFACVLSLLVALYFLIEPVVQLAYRQIPSIKYELREGLSHLRHLLRGINDVTEEVKNTISPEAANNGDGSESLSLPSLSDALFAAPSLAAQVLLFSGALFFILLSRDDVYDWLSKFHSEAPSITHLRDADKRVSRYFLAITLINAGFGALVAVALAALGLPHPILWGVVAFLMNFILYIGPAMVAIMLVVAGLMNFEGALTLAPAAAFISLNALEGQFVTPTLVGHHMRVNPLMIFLSLCFWLWLWGPIGGVIAIPLLVWGMAVFNAFGETDQTISSGTPGTETPNLRAGPTL